MRKWFLVLLTAFLAACSGQVTALTTATSATNPTTATTLTTLTTPTATPTPIPTTTPTPIPTFTPTPTPTVSLPVSLGTPLPPLEPIGDRWGEVREVARYVAPYGGNAWLGQNSLFEVTVYGDKVAVWEHGKQVAQLPLVVEAGNAGTADIRLAVGENRLAVLDKTSQIIDIYDWQGKKVLSVQPKNKDKVVYLTISPNGSLLAYVTERDFEECFWVVDTSTGALHFRQHTSGWVTFSGNSRYLAVPFDRHLDIYDTQTGKVAYSAWMGDWIVPFALSFSGKRLALYHKGQKIVEVIDKGKSIRVIHQRLWGTEAKKIRWVQMMFSPSEQYLGITWGVDKHSEYAVFNIATGKRVEKGDGCLQGVSDTGKATKWEATSQGAFEPSNTPYLVTTANGWEFVSFGQTLYQCVVSQSQYQCHRLEKLPNFLEKRFSQEAFALQFPPFWFQHDEEGNVWAGIWRHWDNSIGIKVLQGTRLLWHHIFVDGTLTGTAASIVGGGLSPDGTLLAIGGIDYGLYPGQAHLLVRFISLKRGVSHPRQLQIKVPDNIFRVPMALCDANHLSIAVPGTPVVVYTLTTQQPMVQLQSDRTIVAMVCNEKALSALDTAGVLHVYGIPALDKAEGSP